VGPEAKGTNQKVKGENFRPDFRGSLQRQSKNGKKGQGQSVAKPAGEGERSLYQPLTSPGNILILHYNEKKGRVVKGLRKNRRALMSASDDERGKVVRNMKNEKGGDLSDEVPTRCSP